jgi:glucokinase
MSPGRESGASHALAADIGGTKTAVALAAADGRWPGIVEEAVYPSQDYASFEAVVTEFLARPAVRPHARNIAAACACVAGPVEGERATTTNLRWTIEVSALRERFAIPQVQLINDFAAVGHGIARLETRDIRTLQQGRPVKHGPRAVIGAGTGLGVALMTWQGGRYVVHESEAGHADFAPVDELQDGLIRHLRQRYGRVSYERVLSGAGLEQIYAYLETRETPSPALRAALDKAPDGAAVVSEFGLNGRDGVAVRALDAFAAVYGAFAGNVALTVLARGGMYIAGGIAPKIATKLEDGTLVRAFVSKGRFSALLETVPLHIVLNARVGLYGALDLARRLARQSRRPSRRADAAR